MFPSRWQLSNSEKLRFQALVSIGLHRNGLGPRTPKKRGGDEWRLEGMQRDETLRWHLGLRTA